MGTTPLQLRKKSFAKLGAFAFNMVGDLIYEYDIAKSDYMFLDVAANLYMSKGAGLPPMSHTSAELLEYYEKNYKTLLHITPNGLIVPKRNTILEYNLLNVAFYRIISRLQIDQHITSWHVPLNLRIKLARPLEENMVRHHPTEHIHTDSWAGESTQSVTTMIPICGDASNNYVQFYEPPSDFQEEWLGPRESYMAGLEIAEKYTKLDYVAPLGSLILSDFATMHSSSRNEGSGPRLSIDTTFALKRQNEEEVIHEWRVNERATTEVVNNLGSKYLFVFPDEPTQQVSSEKGFKHPTNLHIREIV